MLRSSAFRRLAWSLAVATAAASGCVLPPNEPPIPEAPTSLVVAPATVAAPPTLVTSSPPSASQTSANPPRVAAPPPAPLPPTTEQVELRSLAATAPNAPPQLDETPRTVVPARFAADDFVAPLSDPPISGPPTFVAHAPGAPATAETVVPLETETFPEPVAPPSYPNPASIDLGRALQLSAGQNPRVAFAQARVREAYAQLRAAGSLWLPSLRAGVNYNKHEGRIQDVAGNIIDTSRGSTYTGLGAQAVGAGSPAVPGVYANFHLRDAIYNPRIADRLLAAQQRAGQAAVNDVMLETSLAYFDLLEAAQTKAVAEETAANMAQLAELTAEFARVGQGLDADADRSRAELAVRRIEARRAVENVRVASSRLSRLLSQDQGLTLVPEEPSLAPIELVDLSPGLPELIGIGLSNRPELAESRLLAAAAVERLRRERTAPLIPSVLLGTSYGGNGGGLGGTIGNFGDRFDFDVAAYWEIRNLGVGEQAQRAAASARVQQENYRRLQVLDQVAAEIAEAFAQVDVRRGQIAEAEAGIAAAELSYRRGSERIRQGQGLPIETLQAVQALDQARRLYVRTVADYNRAQFRLQRALGWPVLSPR